MSKRKEEFGFLVNGLIWIILGIILIFYNKIFVSKLTYWIGGLLFAFAVIKAIKTFLPSQKLKGLKPRILNLISSDIDAIFATWVINFSPSAPIWLSKGIGFYQLIMTVIYFFNYYLLKKDNVHGRLKCLLFGLINLIWGVTSLFSSGHVENALERLGIYLIFVGITYLNDSKSLFIKKKHMNKFKRNIRVGAPVIFTMLLPAIVLKKFNKFLNEALDVDYEKYDTNKTTFFEGEPVLKVFIHAGETIVGGMGHVDLSYKSRVYSYGSYDVDSERLFNAVGDGTLFSIKEEDYIDYCLSRGKTLFEYTVLLDKDQQKAFEKKLVELKELMIPWNLNTKTQKESYVGIMSKRYEIETFKFSKSRFKTYFVLGTNCVLLADQLIGTSGLDLIAMVGVLSPGAYYDYFDQEYNKSNSIVIDYKVHNAEVRKMIATKKIK